MTVDITPEKLDKIIDLLVQVATKPGLQMNQLISLNDLLELMFTATRVIMEDGSLAEAEIPIKVVGDIHGQFADMLKLFAVIGKVPEVKMMFLGDYVDRGPHSIETVVYLLALKIKYKDKIYLLRGNHETPAVNKIYGFYNECALKYGVGLWWDFQSLFNRFPMAGLISKRILCMHGGLSPSLTSLDQIRQIIRPCEPLDKGLLIDLLWSDPTNKGDGWFYSPRGISYAFGKGVMAAACQLLQLDLVIRAHQVVQDGYELMVGRMLITIFSAPNYAGQFNNAAAVVCIDEEMQVTFQQLRLPPNPGPKANRPSPAVACLPGEALQLPKHLKKPEKKAEEPKSEEPKSDAAPSSETPKPEEGKSTEEKPKEGEEKKAEESTEAKKDASVEEKKEAA